MQTLSNKKNLTDTLLYGGSALKLIQFHLIVDAYFESSRIQKIKKYCCAITLPFFFITFFLKQLFNKRL